MTRKKSVVETLTERLVVLGQKAQRNPIFRRVGGTGAATLLLGTALSVGGVTDALQGVHYLVEKDLDAVRVVRQRGEDKKVVANVHDSFAANSLFKLASVMPSRLVSRQLSLFNEGWIPEGERRLSIFKKGFAPEQADRDVFREEMARVHDAIRSDFFATAMPYGRLIHDKSEKYNVDPALVAAVIEAESRFRKGATSPVGAKGLMQLMPRTGRWMGARDLYNPEQNVDAGVKYIKYLERRFDGNLKKTIAAYNAGEGNVRRYGGVPPFSETRTYVKRVMNNYDKRTKQIEQWERTREVETVAAR